MTQKNPIDMKNGIISALKNKGPMLPVQIAKDVGLETLFAGAFLSELASERAIKISNMKVGGSPLYFIPGHEEMLENFSNYLHGKEKDAFMMLKEKKILLDSNLEPAIRVALRAIKDFASPIIAKENESKLLFWRFHSVLEQEAIEKIKAQFEKKEIEIKPEIKVEEKIKEKVQEESVLESEKPVLELNEKIEERTEKSKKLKANPEQFLEDIKTILSNKNIELLKVESYDKKEVIARVKDLQEYLVIAFNKKKIDDKDLLKAYKKSLVYKLPYIIFIKDEISKKMKEMIEASKLLSRIEKIV